MASFGAISDNFLSDLAYELCFKGLHDGTVYYDMWRGVDRRPEIAKQLEADLEKAYTLSTVATIIPIYVDPEIIDLTKQKTPFLTTVRRVTNRGKAAVYNKLTAKPTAEWLAEDAALSESDTTYTQATANIKFLYSVGRLTGPAMAASKEYINALQQEIKVHTEALRLKEEKTLLRGTTNSGDDTAIYDYNANGYDGLLKQITTNVTNNSGTTEISVAAIRDAIRSAIENGGDPNLCVTDWRTFNKIKSLLQSSITYMDVSGTLNYGIQAINFDGIPIMPCRNMPNTAQKRVFLVLDMSVIELRVLQDVVMQELAVTNDSNKFMVKVYEVGICKAEQFCAKIINLP
ncbi:MAG: phage major capsid protein [Chloroflexi bacterium]|nr:MAG: phage major capsid protein [Chloroflexota bacterium]